MWCAAIRFYPQHEVDVEMEPHPEDPRSGVSKGEAGNCRQLTRSSMQFGTRAVAALVDDAALAEAVQREGGVQRVRRVVRDGMGEAPAGGRRRLEAAVAPAGIERKSVV